jgi:hypothetical protein
LEFCSNFICENTVESSINSEFATGVWRNVGQIDQTLAAELSKELSSSHGSHLQMTQFQSTTCFLHIPTHKYSSSSLHVDSCILVFKKFSHRISSFQDLISR